MTAAAIASKTVPEAGQNKEEILARANKRVAALDVLRGIAIIGTLASNIWLFTGALESALQSGEESPLASMLHWIPNGKFLGLLTIMFGIGLEIQRQAAIRAGKRWPGKYPIRAGLLFLDGVLNYILVVQFDVLRAYAVVGLIVAFLILTSERLQTWLIGLFITGHLALMTFYALTTNPGGALGDIGREEVLSPEEFAALGEDRFGMLQDGAAHGGGYWEDVLNNLKTLGEGFSVDSEFFTILTLGLGLFLLGAKLYRMGIFTPERKKLRYWLMGGGFLVALPLDFLFTQPWFADGLLNQHARYGAAAGVALGILALVAEFYQRRTPGWLGRRMAQVGTMALSAYLLQNIIGVIFQRNVIDAGLLQGFDQVAVTLVAFAVITVILVVFAALWQKRFKRGPFELVWNWCYQWLAGEKRKSLST